MARRKRTISKELAFHIYARSNNRTNFGLPPDLLWEIFSNYLHFLHFGFQVKIHGFVLMANHFHFLGSFPQENNTAALRYFMTETARSINNERGTINHVYGGRNRVTEISDPSHFASCLHYLYRNPVRAQIVKSVEEYKYSSLNLLTGRGFCPIPLSKSLNGIDSIIPENNSELLNWLNTPISEKDIELIRNALKKTFFKLPKVSGVDRRLRLKNLPQK